MVITSVGIAFSLSVWAIPLIQLPQVPVAAKTAEFCEIIERGRRFLGPASRSLAFLTLAVACWSAYAAAPGTWKYYAVAFGMMVSIAPREIVMIFPFSDRIGEFDQQLKKGQSLGAKEEEVVKELLEKWSARHSVRIALPALAAVVTGSGLFQ